MEKKKQIKISQATISATVAGFQQLDKAVIDTSSIIYLTKAGFYAYVSRVLKLFSLPEILNEVGFPIENISMVEALEPHFSNDNKLLATAVALKLPLISEDKKLLLRAQQAKLPYYNSLMMLNFLVFKREIETEAYFEYLTQLKKIARYHPQVWEFGERVFELVCGG